MVNIDILRLCQEAGLNVVSAIVSPDTNPADAVTVYNHAKDMLFAYKSYMLGDKSAPVEEIFKD